jgi:eukaryotic-like serine/threonine-protein kinase
LPKTVGPYALLEPLGAGGMGVVHRARDARLGRDVALKLLPPQAFSDPRARARLLQEARLASALNHPHICTIYEVGEADGEIYIAMEWIEGHSLSQEIPPRGLPVETVLRYGAQIADALAHAHARGIVHRDLKASNVVITPEGRAKVLDFGIAKRIGAHPDDATLEQPAPLTEVGSILGTPGYLAPELLRGEDAGPQSDIWALGTLLYEMATGQKPFIGRTPAELAAAILTQPAAPLPSRLPAGFRALVLRCLEKEPGQRIQQASEIRLALETLLTEIRGSGPTDRRRGRRAAPLVGAAILAALALSAIAMFVARHPWTHPPLEQRQVTSNPPERPIVYGAVSPDGRYLVVVEERDISVRQLDSGEARKLDLPDGYIPVANPFPRAAWYPDGSALLVSGGRVSSEPSPSIWSVPLLGGKPRRIQNDGLLASISPDASRIAYVRQGPSGLEVWCAGAQGEDARRLVPGDSSGVIPCPAWSPSGKRLAFGRGEMGPQGLHVRVETCDLDGNRRLAFDGIPGQHLADFTSLLWLPNGRLIFALTDPAPSQADMNLWSLKVNPRSGVPSGKPVRITQWLRASLLWPSAATANGARVSVDFLRWQSDCFTARIGGGDSTLEDVKRLTEDDRMDMYPEWTEDGRGILFASDRNGTYDIFRQSLDGKDAECLVSGPGAQFEPQMSPDGQWVLYVDQNGPPRAPEARIMRIPVNGGPAEKVLDMQRAADFHCASPPATLSVLGEMQGQETAFFAFDPVTGRGREVGRVEAQPWPAWNIAPDGSALAVVDSRDTPPRIVILSLTGQARREVALDGEVQLTSIGHITWDSSATGWILTGNLKSEWNLFHVDSGGKSTPLLPPQLWMYSSAVSPDGRHIVYTSNTVESNVWLLEHF